MQWADFPRSFSQAHSCARITGSSPRGGDQVATTTDNESSPMVNNLDTQGEDIQSPMVDGTAKKKRVSRIAGGGLRQFSIIVCKKVESKGRTTYSEVADEIIEEFSATDSDTVTLNQYDEKNIRRRVYDAINVLMAMDIIAKDKKEIHWKGFPRTIINDIEELQVCSRLKLMSKIENKATYLHELEEQIVGLHNLMLRNQQVHELGNNVAGVPLPFILVRTRPQAKVEIEISQDMQLVHFDFHGTPFSLHDDTYILKAMRHCRDPELARVLQNSNCAGKSLGSIPFSWHSTVPNA
ncbi:transcription factor-like protein DPB [Magnolia sinica]|uniref:transcription factor-like protein DPB n=1 Tax=Magnolia sinica TaxID=86752 RepID=UPI002658A163|nr:transcription factor-like protein DPB [Magnolia sinica]